MSTSPAGPPRQLRAQLGEVKMAILQQKLERKRCLEAFETQQRALDAKERDLETKQCELETQLSLVVYPVLTLPPEIVARFFVACLPDHGDAVRPCRDTAPLLLTQICRQWREIAITTCTLWASLDIVLRTNPMTDEVRLLETWFLRAKKTPLSITLSSQSSHSEILKPVLSLLSSAAGQLHSLGLFIPHEAFRLFGCDGLAFPNLRCLSVSSGPDNTLANFSVAPSLTELSLYHEPGSLPRSYPLLTSLTLEDVSFTTMSDILRSCPRLLHLEVDIIRNPLAPHGPAPPTPLLESLILRGLDLSPFTLPRLRRLQLDPNNERVVPLLPAFVARSFCALEHLYLPFIETAELAACLRSVPSLTSLSIEFCCIEEFLEVLNIDPPLLSHLRNLRIEGPAKYADYHGLVQLLRSPPAHLISLDLHLCDPDWLWHKEQPAEELSRLRCQSARTEFEQFIAQTLSVQVSVCHEN
ncbi:hypothetical protein DFH06DRAFT_1115499 [Mycena polygramma]|nr:hypothetical protein DFH06DRAFT_1115499 [Mycena polygramma]